MVKRPVNIVRIDKLKKQKLNDIVLIESPIDIIVNSEPFVNIICLPKDLKELAVGFLYSIGIINKINQITDIRVNEVKNQVYVDLDDKINFSSENLEINPVGRIIDSSCGISSPWRDTIKKTLEKEKEVLPLKDDIKLNPEIIFSAIKEIYTKMTLYRETGGCHGAAIFNFDGNLLSIKEDIGRHNAIDKVFGDMLIKKRNFKDIFLTSSGRLTGDCVLKAVRAKIPIVASVSAAIESGIRLAFAYGITLIGFVRGSRMNIYTHPYRISV
ncbi:MAG: formate dehydrogenase accessory sulfurtransferase FdhD [Promethearchaeota archaeon]|nr:MAG: formate dehydrogenase accessory sulfurtransferase FdhD [Candidatus Lokiarchaeota archaeon]